MNALDIIRQQTFLEAGDYLDRWATNVETEALSRLQGNEAQVRVAIEVIKTAADLMREKARQAVKA